MQLRIQIDTNASLQLIYEFGISGGDRATVGHYAGMVVRSTPLLNPITRLSSTTRSQPSTLQRHSAYSSGAVFQTGNAIHPLVVLIIVRS